MSIKNSKSSIRHLYQFHEKFLTKWVFGFCALATHIATAALSPLPTPLHTVKLAWTAVSESGVSGYRLYIGTTSRQYTTTYDSGSTAAYTINGIESGKPYYIAVKAVTIGGLESDLSEELVVTISPTPVAASDSYAAVHNKPLVVPAAGVLANDKDVGSYVLTAVATSEPAHGSLAMNADGGFTYTPAAGFVGADSFTYYANDGFASSSAVTVSLQVMPSRQLLVNGSFESGFYGWTASGNGYVETSGTSYKASNGSQLVVCNGNEQSPNALLSQSFPTAVGMTYTVEFDAGVLAYNTSAASMVVAVTGNTTLLSKSVSVSGSGAGATRWISQSLTFVADSTQATLSFRDTSVVASSIDLLIDNVRVTGADVSSVVTTLGSSVDTIALTGVPGAARVGMNASKAGSYVLERSEDLANWVPVGTMNLTAPGPVEFADDSVPAKGKIFYRIGLR